MYEDNHLSDHELLLAADGELSSSAAAWVQSHLTACWSCRARKQQLDSAVTSFIRSYRRTMDSKIPSTDGPRALLRARIEELSWPQPNGWRTWFRLQTWRWSVSALIIACLVVLFSMAWTAIPRMGVRAATFTVPNPSLTPGATVSISGEAVCREPGAKNKQVSRALRRRVFEEYGIPGAEPRAYEVDYLITPALGGADDIHNLWPESSVSTVWNAQVKDALEDHLREMVCSGQLDLATAQHEIAVNWIAAYKKYFHTNHPPAVKSER
jgi:anti-sigma factor RsiW